MQGLLPFERDALAALCRTYRVRRLALFGSAARPDFDPSRSDVDLLAEFEDPQAPGYADRYLDFALAAENILHRPVDVITPKSIVNPFLARSIARDQIELYAA